MHLPGMGMERATRMKRDVAISNYEFKELPQYCLQNPISSNCRTEDPHSVHWLNLLYSRPCALKSKATTSNAICVSNPEETRESYFVASRSIYHAFRPNSPRCCISTFFYRDFRGTADERPVLEV